MSADQDQAIRPWQRNIHSVFNTTGIRHVSCVPDGGHHGLIDLCVDDPEIGTTVLTTEEEGVGHAAGLMLGGTPRLSGLESRGLRYRK